MLLVALITSALTVRIKTQASLAVERERRTEVLYEINKQLLVTRNLKGIINLTNEYILHLFSRSVIFILLILPKVMKGFSYKQKEKKMRARFLVRMKKLLPTGYLKTKNERALGRIR